MWRRANGKRQKGLHAAGLAALVLLAGCVQTRPAGEVELATGVPDGWTVGALESPVADNWLAEFGDPGLEALVGEALHANLSLQAAVARYDQAVALARIEGAERWPSLNLGGTAARQMANNRMDPPLRNRSDRFDLGLSANWELDLWGRVRARVRGAEADLFAAEAELAAFRLSLGTLVAQAWFNAIEARKQEALALETLRSFESNLETVEERFRNGLSPALDLRLTRANVAAARATHAQQRRLADLAVRQLEVLAGRYPAAELALPQQLPPLDEPVPTGVPSGILVRRPDIGAAAQRVVGAEAATIESRRALLPAISLTASYGRASSELEDILRDSFDVWSLLGNVTAPLFQGGRLRASVDLSDARFREAVASYQEVVLTAFREVEAALAAEEHLGDQMQAVQLAVEESVAAQELAEERYESGLVDIITVLESQRRAFNARIAALSVQNQLLQNRLSLYLALGGNILPSQNF